MGRKFYGLTSVNVLGIDGKDILSEDRIIYTLIIRFVRTNKKLNGRIGMRIINQMGRIGSEGMLHINRFLQSSPGTSENG